MIRLLFFSIATAYYRTFTRLPISGRGVLP